MNVHYWKNVNQNKHSYSARKNISSTDGTIISGKLIECGGIDRPRFELIINDYPEIYVDIDYIYVPQFGRFYFCKVSLEKGNKLYLDCESDTLKNFYPQLKSQTFYIEKNQNGTNKYLPDNTLAIPSNYEIKSYNFSEPLINSGNQFILQLMSGGASI